MNATASPDISILMPVYNEIGTIADILDVVKTALPGKLKEIIVVDDGSTDAETLRILDALRADGRHVVSGPCAGLSAARNTGLRTSRTLAVLPLDAAIGTSIVDVLGLGDPVLDINVTANRGDCMGVIGR